MRSSSHPLPAPAADSISEDDTSTTRVKAEGVLLSSSVVADDDDDGSTGVGGAAARLVGNGRHKRKTLAPPQGDTGRGTSGRSSTSSSSSSSNRNRRGKRARHAIDDDVFVLEPDSETEAAGRVADLGSGARVAVKPEH